MLNVPFYLGLRGGQFELPLNRHLKRVSELGVV